MSIALLFWNNFPNARSRTNSGLFQDRTFLTASQSRVFRTFDMLRQETDFAGTHHIYSKRIALHLILVKFNSKFKNFTSADTSGSRIVNQTRIGQKWSLLCGGVVEVEKKGAKERHENLDGALRLIRVYRLIETSMESHRKKLGGWKRLFSNRVNYLTVSL